MLIQQIPFGSSLYEATTRFREEILRRPLGLVLSPEDVRGEDAQIHIAALMPSGIVQGTVLLKPLTPDIVKLRQMAVAPALQGTGIGRQLVGFAEKLALGRGFRTVELHARVTATVFYAKLGYREDGPEFVEVTVPTIRMVKRL